MQTCISTDSSDDNHIDGNDLKVSSFTIYFVYRQKGIGTNIDEWTNYALYPIKDLPEPIS